VQEPAGDQDQTRAKHHYVTCAYLKNMLAPGETRLWVYERNSPRVFRNIPANLASARAYYTIIHKNGEEDDRFEKILATEVESPGIAVIRKLSDGFSQLKMEEIVRGRVPNMRHQLLTMMKGVGNSFYKSMMSRPGLMESTLRTLQDAGKISTSVTAEEIRRSYEEDKFEIVPAHSADLWALGLSLESLIETYSAMKWTVLVAPEPMILTSDAPLCREYPETASFPAGVVNPDLTIHFPISARRVLMLQHDRKKHERAEQLIAAGRKREAERLWNQTPSILYRFISAAQAERINRITIERAMRWIYSPVEKPETPTLFRGEPRNLRVEMRELDQIGTLQATFRIGEPDPEATGPE
jgi:hypothetical protein